jgi:periplasmic protein TonB
MKTTDTAFKPAVYAETFDDIIFDGRNLKYGAYFLRKTYTHNLSLSLLVSLSVAALLTLLIFLHFKNLPAVENPKPAPPVIVIAPSGITPVTPPPPVTDLPKKETGIKATGPMVVVEEVTDPNQPPTQEELKNQPAGNAIEGTGVLVYIDPAPDGVVDEEKSYKDYEVNEQAMFRGGSVEEFRAWLVRKIRYPDEAAINGIKGMVFVKFAVGKDGKICDVVVEKGIHPIIDQAVVNALLSSPLWKPAKKNGREVKVFYHVPVKFDLQQ